MSDRGKKCDKNPCPKGNKTRSKSTGGTHKSVGQGKTGEARAEETKSKSGSKSKSKSQSKKSLSSTKSEDKSKSSSGSTGKKDNNGVVDNYDNFDEFNADVKSLTHKSIDNTERAQDDLDLRTTLRNKSWMDEDDDTDFSTIYQREKDKK